MCSDFSGAPQISSVKDAGQLCFTGVLERHDSSKGLSLKVKDRNDGRLSFWPLGFGCLNPIAEIGTREE